MQKKKLNPWETERRERGLF